MTPASLYLARRRTSHKRGSVIYKALPLVTYLEGGGVRRTPPRPTSLPRARLCLSVARELSPPRASRAG